MNILEQHYQKHGNNFVATDQIEVKTEEDSVLIMTLEDMAASGKSRGDFYCQKRAIISN